MTIKKTLGKNFVAGLLAAGAALSMCVLSACSEDAGVPGGAGVEAEETDAVAAEFSKEPVPEIGEGAAKPAVPDADGGQYGDAGEVSPEEPVAESSSSEPESSASLDSIMSILFPEGIDIDTARHEPDSLGVWHFYDPRGTHDNPDFAYGSMTDPRDGNVYKTTTIGGQVWMAENLNYFDIEGAASSIKNDWCYWDKPENCESAGRLYTWKVAQRICPEGWRLPTKADWETLLQEVGADSLNEILWKGSSKLKSMSGWENDGSGTDDFGFTALPAGMKFTTRTQDGIPYHGCSSLMWAATEADGGAADSLAYHMYLDCSNDNAIVKTVRKIDGLSVRCVKE